MDIINEYKNRFYNLLESTMGDVRPLITENTVSGSPKFNQIVTNLGLEISEMVENGGYETTTIKNGNQLFGHNFGEIELKISPSACYLYFTEFISKFPNQTNNFVLTIEFNVQNLDLDFLKTIVQNVINGKIDKNYITDETPQKFYEFYEKNNLEGYDAKIKGFVIETYQKKQINRIIPHLLFVSKNPENKVKSIKVSFYVHPSYSGIEKGHFNKDYVLNGNQISFDKDRKETKGSYKTKDLNNETLYGLSINNTYVKKGMKGNTVRQIQQALLRSGQLTTAVQLAKDNEACKKDYKQCHGTFGNQTFNAVREFQLANDIKDDGIVGPDTAHALFNITSDGVFSPK